MQRAEMADRLAEHRLDLVFLADIRLDHDRLAADALDDMRRLVGGRPIANVIDHDIRPGLGKPDRGRLADPGTAPGHQGRLPDQVFHIRGLGRGDDVGQMGKLLGHGPI